MHVVELLIKMTCLNIFVNNDYDYDLNSNVALKSLTRFMRESGSIGNVILLMYMCIGSAWSPQPESESLDSQEVVRHWGTLL